MSGLTQTPFFGLTLSIIAYFIGVKAQKRFRFALCNSMVVAVAIIIAVLGLGMSAIYPTTVAAAGPIIEGSTMGLSLLTGISAIGGILVPQIIGILADHVGIAGAMVTVVLTVGIMLALSILAVLRDRRGLMG